MKIVLFYHSLLSDWNHGNAHFLRGIVSELLVLGHEPVVYEPADAWSLKNLLEEHGEEPIAQFHRAYPSLQSKRYTLSSLDIAAALDGAGLVLVHEWNDPSLVRQLGEYRRSNSHFRLLFHDTHHRAVTDEAAMAAYDLTHYDGVLAYGNVLREIYLAKGWAQKAWTWHEAADVRLFKPIHDQKKKRDLVWIGNWGDEERTAELHEYLIEPARDLKLSGAIHGVRYPPTAQHSLAHAGLEYRGWLPNFLAPEVFSKARFTVHVPRRPYVERLPGIPTIRPFEALACKIPLICTPWEDTENLFRPGRDYLIARNGNEMKKQMRAVLSDGELVEELTASGLETILEKHTCSHRATELLRISEELAPSS